ncbi:MAG: hypothetical protein L3K10_03260 [Thermoplasmata archaeon]|nr:hypothetical protein [Thermoplasmata archaeon]
MGTQAGVFVTWFGVRFIGPSLQALGVVGIGVGILVLAFAQLFLLRPARHRLWGKVVITLSGIGVVTCFYGGIVLGLFAGAAGGWLGYRSDPTLRDPD